MFATIVTWAGAMLGVTVLLLMAFGSVAIDFESPRRDREPAERSQDPSG